MSNCKSPVSVPCTMSGVYIRRSYHEGDWYANGPSESVPGLRGTHSAVIQVAAGDLLELRCAMNCLDIANQEFSISRSNLSVHYTK